MTTRRPPSRIRHGLGLVLGVALVALASECASAQVDPTGLPLAATRDGMGRPQFPPAGGWGRVLTVTDKWLVLENEDGQQFPVAFDAIRLFVMRWPTSPERISPDALIEASGLDLGSRRVQTDHVDVYEGSARNMVSPTYLPIIGYNRVVTLFDIEQQNLLGINYQYMLLPGEELMPARLHVVGPPAGVFPLAIGVGGNGAVAVVPMPSGLTMTQVTEGVPSYVQPGDLAFVAPVLSRSTPRSLAVDQLVVYKAIPLDQFAR